MDSVQINLSDAFAAGQVYVALSRVRTLDGLELLAPLQAGTRIATSAAVAAYEAAFAPTAPIPGLPQRRSLCMNDLQSVGGGWWQKQQPPGSVAAQAAAPPRVYVLAGSRRCALGAQPCRSGMCGTVVNAGDSGSSSARGGSKYKCRMCAVCGIYSGVHT